MAEQQMQYRVCNIYIEWNFPVTGVGIGQALTKNRIQPAQFPANSQYQLPGIDYQPPPAIQLSQLIIILLHDDW